MSSPGGSGPWPPPDQGHGYGAPQGHGNSYYTPSGQQPQNPSGMRYQGFGVYDNTPPGMVPPPKRRRWPVLVGASVAVLAVVVATVLITTSGQRQATPAAPTTSESSEPSSPTTSSSAPTTKAESLPPQSAVVPGWQAVGVPRRKAVYDTPSDWALETPDDVIAYGEPDDPITMTGVALYRKGFCPGKPTSYRALTGATARKGGSDAEVARTSVRKLANLVYSVDGKSPEINMAAPEQVRLDQGASTGTLVTANVTHPDPGPCDSPTSVVQVLARDNQGQSSVVHFGIAEQGVPDAFPPDALRTIALSFRPAK